MVKKVLKNKFFILFSSFVIIVITARFSPVYSLNDRLITLAIGIEEKNSNFLVTIEAIKPNKEKEDYIAIKGEGITVSSAINNIENESGKKVSLAQCEVVFLQKNLIEKQNIKFLQSDRLKNIPEIAVNVVCDSPSEIIGSSILGNKLNSYNFGSNIRKNKDDLYILEVNNKDLGKDYLSFLGSVTIPYIEVVSTIKQEDKTGSENKKQIKIKSNKLVSFNKNNVALLNENESLIYLLLSRKSSNKKGNLTINFNDNKSANLFVSNIKIKKEFNVINNNYLAKYDVYIKYFDNETFIMQNNDINSKSKITKENKTFIENKLNEYSLLLANQIAKQKIDILHLFDEFYPKYQSMLLNGTDFIEKLKLDVNFVLEKTDIKG